MVRQPLVTVVTPVFNGERYIRRTIESILNQKYKNIEFIVIDGGSTDSTLLILESYQNNISKLISEEDSGMYDALNKGFKISSGDIFCYLNADDYFFPDTIELVVNKFNATGSQLVFGDCILVDENERELSRYYGVELSLPAVRVLGRIPFAQQTAFWTRQLHSEIGGFDDKYKYVGDTKFFFQCLNVLKERPAHIDAFLAMFRQHNQGFSYRVRDLMAEEHNRVLADLNIRHNFLRIFVESFVKVKNLRNFLRRLLLD